MPQCFWFSTLTVSLYISLSISSLLSVFIISYVAVLSLTDGNITGYFYTRKFVPSLVLQCEGVICIYTTYYLCFKVVSKFQSKLRYTHSHSSLLRGKQITNSQWLLQENRSSQSSTGRKTYTIYHTRSTNLQCSGLLIWVQNDASYLAIIAEVA